jgi:cryptochrome
MKVKLSDEDWIRKFEKPKTSYTSIKPDTTALSAYLALGCVSVRTFWHGLESVNKRGNHTLPPVSL